MSKYTTQIRFLCESEAGLTSSTGFEGIDNVLNIAAPKIFDFSWPIFDENYRIPLEKKILRHYYTREISEETVGLWKLRLQDRLNMIMPYYNQLYKSELIEFNPMYDVDLTTTHNKDNNTKQTTENTSNQVDHATEGRGKTDTNEVSRNREVTSNNTSESKQDGTTSGNSSGNRTDWDFYSDTPQGDLTGVNERTYLTNLRKKTAEETAQNSGTTSATTSGSTDYSETNDETENVTFKSSETIVNDFTRDTMDNGQLNATNTEEYTQKVLGKTAGTSYSKLLSEFRETFINIDLQVINDLKDLFFGLWE